MKYVKKAFVFITSIGGRVLFLERANPESPDSPIISLPCDTVIDTTPFVSAYPEKAARDALGVELQYATLLHSHRFYVRDQEARETTTHCYDYYKGYVYGCRKVMEVNQEIYTRSMWCALAHVLSLPEEPSPGLFDAARALNSYQQSTKI